MTSTKNLHCLCMTSNIGTIECSTPQMTDENKKLMQEWTSSVRAFIQAEEKKIGVPIDVFALHLQEIGGKKFNAAFNEYLEAHIRECFPGLKADRGSWCSGVLMPDADDGVTFTAMGTVIYVSSRCVPVVSILSFRHRTYIPLCDNPLSLCGNQRRALFHGTKFSNAGTSRKGFLLVSLRVGMKILNVLNMHLFHDEDNTKSSLESPSEYAKRRVDAVAEALDEISVITNNDQDSLLVFGDFNFRLDLCKLLKMIRQQFNAEVTLGKKTVQTLPAVWEWMQDPTKWAELRNYDCEGPEILAMIERRFGIKMAEPTRSFGPTYLLETDPELRQKNVTTPEDDLGNQIVLRRDRFPAWCDRVLMNVPAAASMQLATYWTAPTCLMDHRSVFLQFMVNWFPTGPKNGTTN